MARLKFLKDGSISEQSIHKYVLEYISKKYPKFRQLILHFPNEGKRSPRYGALMKALGMRKGVADLFIAVPKRGFGGAWIELKSENGVLSMEQEIFLQDMKAQNFYACVCFSANDAIEMIDWYFNV